MAKIQNISEIHPTLGFTEFDVLEKYRKSFNESELGRLHSMFPFERMAKAIGLCEQRLGRKNIFSPSAKIALMVLKSYTGFSDRYLVEHLNGNIHYQMFCGVMIDPNHKTAKNERTNCPIRPFILSETNNRFSSCHKLLKIADFLFTAYSDSNSFSISSTVGKLPRKSFGKACPNS